MLNFIKLTSVESEHIKLVEPEHCHYKSGDKVRIVEGDFAGVIGRVARIAGQQRVVVELNKLCMVATAYIPSAFLSVL
jgi:transcription antitermination factor NusG